MERQQWTVTRRHASHSAAERRWDQACQLLLVEELQKHKAEVAFLDRPMSRDPHDCLVVRPAWQRQR